MIKQLQPCETTTGFKAKTKIKIPVQKVELVKKYLQFIMPKIMDATKDQSDIQSKTTLIANACNQWLSATENKDSIPLSFHVKKNFGRLVSKKIISPVQIKRCVRNYLFENMYTDLDINNAHIEFAFQLYPVLLNGKIPEGIQYIVKNRQAIFQPFMDEHKLTKDQCKTFVFTVCYKGSLERTLRKLGFESSKDLKKKSRWAFKKIQNAAGEFENLAKAVKQHMGDTWKTVHCSEKSLQQKREDVSKFSIVMQHIEHKITFVISEYLKSKYKLEVADYQYDGVYIDCNNHKLIETIIPELEQEITKQTGFKLKLSIKPIDGTEVAEIIKKLQTEISDDSPELLEGSDVDSDLEACEVFWQIYKNEVVITESSIYCLDKFTHLYQHYSKYDRFNPLLDMVLNLRLTRNNKPYSANNANAKNIVAIILAPHRLGGAGGTSLIINDVDFIDKINLSSKGLLFFTDKVWNFATRKFEEFGDRYTLCNTGYPAPVEQFKALDNQGDNHTSIQYLKRTIFNSFETQEEVDYTLFVLARALAGHVEDKFFSCWVGERDCGKGTFMDIIKCAVGNYARDSTPPICSDISNSDVAQRNRFASTSKINTGRLCFTNEAGIAKKSNSTITLDGEVIKSVIASGGDVFQTRRMKENEQSMKNNCIFFMLFNSYPKANPYDAFQTCLPIIFPKKFTKKDPEVVGLEDCITDLRDQIKQPKLFTTFLWCLLHAYKPIPARKAPKIESFSKSLIELDSKPSTHFDVFKNHFISAESSVLAWADVRDVFDQYIKITPQALRKFLEKQRCRVCKARYQGLVNKVVKGIELRGQSEPQDELDQVTELSLDQYQKLFPNELNDKCLI